MSILSGDRGHDDGLVSFTSDDVARYRSSGWWSGRPLGAQLVDAVQANAVRTALITDEVTWTYDDLLDRAVAFAAGVHDVAGVAPGEAVMFQMGNVAETIVAYFGCLLAAVRPVCTLPMHGTREIALLARHTGARALLVQGDFGGDRLLDQARQLGVDGVIDTTIVARAEPFAGALAFDALLEVGRGRTVDSLPFRTVPLEQAAVFQLSGGTTGLPKVAARMHEEYAYNSRAWAAAMGYGPETVLLWAMPVMHNAGISLAVQPAILAGCCLVLSPSAKVAAVVKMLERHRPDVLPCVPPALAIRLLESPEVTADTVASIRDFVVGGQRLPVEVAVRLRDRLNIAVRQMFGMAEGMFLLTPPGASEYVRHHTIGEPISAGDEIRILDIADEDEVADGEVGEFVARGPYTIRGYYRAAAHNVNAFTRDGAYRTGDLARRHVTDEGVFYSIEGRIKDVINRGAEKIHAEEVEELIATHPSVAACALVAMPDPVLGERGCAYLELEPDAALLDVAALGTHLLAQGLAKYKLPERVEVVTALPLTKVGKISKVDLRKDIATKIAAQARPETHPNTQQSTGAPA